MGMPYINATKFMVILPATNQSKGLNLQARSHATANQASNSSADHLGNVGDFVQTLNPNQYQHLLAMRILIWLRPRLVLKLIWQLHTHQVPAYLFPFSQFSILLEVTYALISFCFEPWFPFQTPLWPFPIIIVFLFNSLDLSNSYHHWCYMMSFPQFQFNLLSLSFLTRNSSVHVRFLIDYCVVQEMPNLKTIGMGNLVHCDTWSPYHIPTHYQYFLTLVDDCTKFTWVYLMKQKSDVSFIIPKFFSLIETQFSKVIKRFRSDKEPELQYTDFFNAKGILHQFSCWTTWTKFGVEKETSTPTQCGSSTFHSVSCPY